MEGEPLVSIQYWRSTTTHTPRTTTSPSTAFLDPNSNRQLGQSAVEGEVVVGGVEALVVGR